MVSYESLLQEVEGKLTFHHIAEAHLEAQELLAHCAGLSKAQLLRDRKEPLPEAVATGVNEALTQRLQGKPLPYILGEWEFYGLRILLNAHTLIPRPDTELLVSKALDIAKTLPKSPEKPLEILDLCAGSGCIGIAMAKYLPHSNVLLGDISPEAREMCQKNTELHGLEDRVSTVELDAGKPSPYEEKFHLLLSNPPYISQEEMSQLPPSVYHHEPHLALEGGEDGYDFYHSILGLWKQSLKPQGTLLVEVGHTQEAWVKKLMEIHGFVDIHSHLDTQNIPRVIQGTVPVSSDRGTV